MNKGKVVYDTKHYEVRTSGDWNVIDEAGVYSERGGYVVVNKDTEIVEHTTMIMPQAIYQAQGFSDSLDALLSPSAQPAQLELVNFPIDEDVVPS